METREIWRKERSMVFRPWTSIATESHVKTLNQSCDIRISEAAYDHLSQQQCMSTKLQTARIESDFPRCDYGYKEIGVWICTDPFTLHRLDLFLRLVKLNFCIASVCVGSSVNLVACNSSDSSEGMLHHERKKTASWFDKVPFAEAMMAKCAKNNHFHHRHASTNLPGMKMQA